MSQSVRALGQRPLLTVRSVNKAAMQAGALGYFRAGEMDEESPALGPCGCSDGQALKLLPQSHRLAEEGNGEQHVEIY